MEGSTHFYEVYRHWDGSIENTGICGIDFLDEFLDQTKNTGGYTIAVWYIKPKVK